MKTPFLDLEYELPSDEEQRLIELSCYSTFKMLFPKVNVTGVLVPFSHLVHMKNKYRNRLNVEPNLRLKLSSFDPDMRNLTSQKQHQPSHYVSVKFIILGLTDMFIFIRKSPFIQYCIVIDDTFSVVKL
jgi:hypothetical protein